MMTDIPTSALAMFMKQTGMTPPEQMKQWGNPSQPTSTIGKREWSQEGADKAQSVLEGLGSFAPWIGQGIAVKDYNEAMANNDTVGGVLASAQMIPVLGGTAKLGSTFLRGPSSYALKMMRRGSPVEQGMATAVKHGSKASGTANIAQLTQDVTK